MKKKYSRILGVTLALMLLASLFGFAVPVSAQANPGAWTPVLLPPPGQVGGFIYNPAGPTAFIGGQYITQGIDGTLWCYNPDGAAAAMSPFLYKSTDGGRSWTQEGQGLAGWGGGFVLTDILCSPENANTLWVSTATLVYVSTNGGMSFSALVPNALQSATAVITSIDVGYIGGSPYLFMGTADPGVTTGGVYVLGPAYGGGWTDMMVTNAANATVAEEMATAALPAAGGVDVYEVACAPDFSTQQLIIAAVMGAAADGVMLVTKYGGSNWNVGPTFGAPAAPSTPLAPIITVPTSVEIRFPGNFNSNAMFGMMEYFVAVDTGGAAVAGDVFRVVLATAFDTNVGGFGTATDITGLDVVGDIGVASVIAGQANANATFTSTNYTTTWTRSAKPPAGAAFLTWVVMADDFGTSGKAWASTSGADGGVYLTENSGTSWNGVGLLGCDITGVGAFINDFAVGVDSAGNEIVFVAINTVTNLDDLWRYDGTNWELIYTEPVAGPIWKALLVEVTDTFATDGRVFIADNALGQIQYSFDQGEMWIPQLSTVPALALGFTAWLVIDANTIWVGDPGAPGMVEMTSNNGTTWMGGPPLGPGNGIASLAKSPSYTTDRTVAAGDIAGLVFVEATGSGFVWNQIPAGAPPLAAAAVFVTFNSQNADMLYVVEASAPGATGNVWRYTLGDAAWGAINQFGAFPPLPSTAATTQVAAGSTGIACGPDGDLYVSDVSPGVGLLRCSNSLAPFMPATPAVASPFWEAISGAFPVGAVTGGKIVLTPGKIWVYDNTAAVMLLYFEDTTTVAPINASPASGTMLDTQTGVVLTWDAVPGATAYIVRYNQSQFGWSGATNVIVFFSTALNIPAGLVPGATYHWDVMVNVGSPAISPRSEAWEFTTAMGAGQWTPGAVGVGPPAGATDQPLLPAFQWNPSVAGTTGYEFELSTSSATGAGGYFTTTVVSKIGASALTNTVYTSEVTLEYGTAYVWHVRAISATGQSNWFTGTFTTVAEVEPAVVVVTEPAEPALPAEIVEIPVSPPVPNWALYTIIIVGAVLVVFVIVLIMRTRRPV